MNTQNTGVPLYRPYIPGTAVHSDKNGTVGGTRTGTPSLKSLAVRYLGDKKAVQSVVQNPVHSAKKCTTVESTSGTLFEAKNIPASIPTHKHPSITIKPRHCTYCGLWRDILGKHWHWGNCAFTGAKVDHKSFCQVPEIWEAAEGEA